MTGGEEIDVFRAMSDDSPNMIFINNFHHVVYANSKCSEILGYTNDEFLSPSFDFMDLIAPESRPFIIEATMRHRNGQEIEPYEYVLLTKDGERIEVVILTKLIQWEGNPAILGTVTDISGYKKLENQLRKSEEKYMLLLDSSNDGVFGIKEDQFVYVNKQAADILGYEKDEILELPILDIVAPSHRDLVMKRTSNRLNGGNPPNRYEVKLIRKDGGTLDVEFNVSSMEYDGGPMNLTVARDISDTIRHRNRLMALLGHAVNLSSASSMEEIIMKTLEAMEQALEFQFSSFLEVTEEGLLVRSRFSESDGLVLPLDGPGLTVKAALTKRSQLVNDTTDDPDYTEGYFHSLSELDVPIILENKVVGVLNAEGKTTNQFTDNDLQVLKLLAIHVSSAIDRINRLEEVEALRQQQFQQLIDGFKKTSAAVRHDLRSPLMTIINATRVLSIQPDNERMKEILEAKTGFIETVLDDWKQLIYSGEVNRIPVNLLSLFMEVLASNQAPKGVETLIDVDDSVIFPLDKNGMVRVVSNLVKNSIESIDGTGTITLSASLIDDALTVKVQDTGLGIPEDLLPNVFTPFFTTKETGTGIGLSYVKETVEAHGGAVDIHSEEGKGTVVTLHFPTLKE